MNTESDSASSSTLARVNEHMAALERRDSELWLIVVVTSSVIAFGLLATISPAVFRKGGNFHFEITISRELFVALIVMIAMLDIYLVQSWLRLRRARQTVISTTFQSELVRLQSFTDPLAETYNRRSLDEMMARYMNHAQRSRKPLTFLMVDLDSFKQVNTRFGHLTGDFVISEIASLLKHSVRGCDSVIRYGGDEFLIVLMDTNETGAQNVIDRIHRYALDWNRGGHLKDFALTMSVGCCEWRDGMTIDGLLNQADGAMYAAKASGRKVGHASA